MASTSGSINNGATGNGSPYPNVFTFSWTSTLSGNTYTINWQIMIDGGSSGYCQSYWNGVCVIDGTTVWGSGASDTSCRGSYSASCAQGHVVTSGSFTRSGGAGFSVTIGGGFYTSAAYSENSASWTLPTTYTPPAQPTVTISEKYVDGAKFSVSLSSYGNPSAASGRYIEAAILAQSTYGATYKYATSQNTSSATITVNNSSAGGTLDIKSNTRYWYGGYASNTQKNNSIVTGQFYTLPAAPVASSFNQASDTSATFSVTESSVGSGQTVQLQYRYKKHTDSNYGSWTNVGSAGNRQTVSATLTGLTSGDYDVQVRAKAGSADYSAISTYENAFSFISPTITVTNAEFTYNSPSVCDVTFIYTISALSSAANHTISAVATSSSSQTYSGNFTNQPVSGTFTITGLPYSETFSLSTTVDGGAASTFTFETPGAEPTFTLVSAAKDARGSKLTLKIKGSFGFGAAGYNNTIQMVTQVYNSATNSWESSGVSTSISSHTTASYNVTKTFTHTASNPNKKVYPKYTKVKWIFVITNANSGLYITKGVITELPPYIGGKIILSSGARSNIIGTAIKDKNGTLSDIRYNWPIVTIK